MHPITYILQALIPNTPHQRVTMMTLVNYFLILVTIVHYSACLWLYIGDKYMLNDDGDPWMVANDDFHGASLWKLYVFSMYWIFVCITTVGYGDYTGGSMAEILVTLGFEFMGLFTFSVLMSIVTDVMSKSYDYDEFRDEKTADMQLRILNVEKCRDKKFLSPMVFQTINKNFEDSLQYNYNLLVDEFEFFSQLPPRMQSDLVRLIFKSFLNRFDYFFDSLDSGFVNEIVVNMYAKTYQPGDDIVTPGQRVDAIMFVLQGQLQICEKNGEQEPFCVLPTNSFFGEY